MRLIITISFVLIRLTCFTQVDRVFIQSGLGENLKSYYFEGLDLEVFLDTLKSNPIRNESIRDDKMCTYKIWFITKGNYSKNYAACSFNDLRLDEFQNALIEIDLSIKKIIGHQRAVKIYDSLQASKQNFMVSPSILSEKKYELSEMAFFKDTIDHRSYLQSEIDSIYYHDLYLPAYNQLRSKYTEIDSSDFLFAPWINNELIVVINLKETKFKLKPFKKLGIYFIESPEIKERKYSFAIFNKKDE
jgi:hypothetical protein